MTATPTETKYELGGWSLDDLFPNHDGEEMSNAFAAIEAGLGHFQEYRDDLNDDITLETLLSIVRDMEKMTRTMMRIYGYAGLWFNENTQDQKGQAFNARVQQFMATSENQTLFFSLWWKSLDEAVARPLLAGAGEYRYFLEEMRNFKPHTLSEPEEKIINIKNTTGPAALNILYDSITTRYTFDLEVDGEMKTGLTRDALMKHAYSPNPDVRARAYQVLFEKYREDAPILGQIYQTLVRDWRNENIDLRHFANPMSVRNLRNDIPDEVVDTLLNVTQKNAGVYQRYFKLKAKWLGTDKIRRYDLYAPVIASEKSFEYEEAIAMTYGAFGDFSAEVEELARQVFDQDHVDSELRKGKAGGAFCWGPVPDITPWVLLNYAGNARDIAVMAHELGHAVHAMLASHHPIFTAGPTLPLAETASTFSEMLLVDYLLARETDEEVRRDILFTQMDTSYAVIMRQVFFALFERQAHEMIVQGASVDDLAKAYFENLEMQFGDSLELSDEFKWEWVMIPHIYEVPFYVYAYAFGQLLVLALYKQYKAEGASFIPRYLEILRAGGSAAPVDILNTAGIDVTKASFWQGGFDVINEMLDELEAIPLPW